MPIHVYERIFLWLTIGTLAVFLAAILAGTLALGVELPARTQRIAPTDLATDELFSEPGVFELAPGHYRVVMTGQIWSFTPNEIRVPVGATITLHTTSRDVIHGLKVLGTNINVMFIPGQTSTVTHTFRRPGEYLMVCHEYCGVGHQAMYGKILVEPATEAGGAPPAPGRIEEHAADLPPAGAQPGDVP